MPQRSNASKAAAELSALMMFSPMVIASRLTQFWLSAAAPTTKDHTEASLMVTEKLQAAGESLLAMNVAASRAMVDAATAAMTGGSRNANVFDDIFLAGLKPYSTRVRANNKRLSK